MKFSTIVIFSYAALAVNPSLKLTSQEDDQVSSHEDITWETDGPGFYTLKEKGSKVVKIPFRMHHGKPLMDLNINGAKATMMIDNGILWDQIWLFGSPLVEALELKPLDEHTVGGAGEGDPTRIYSSSDLELDFGDIIFHDQPVLVSPPEAGFSQVFPGADGQLCNTFFKHFIVEFDFIKQLVILHKPNEFEYKGSGSVVDMKLNESGTHSIPFSFTMMDGTAYTGWVDIDFGGIYPLKIALNNKNGISLPSEVEAIASYGAQGRSSEYSGMIRSMIFGDYTFEDVKAVFGDEKTSRIHPDNLGVVGLPLFMKFDITFDYFNHKIYFEPNRDFSESF